jgi:Mn-dependent DtxR family transcriptional regulator
MLEILLNDDGAAFAGEISETLPVGKTRARQILAELADDGLVRIKNVSDVNIYSLTEEGHSELLSHLRAEID